MPKTPAWQRKEGQNPKGGLNAKGRASYRTKSGKKGNLKAPVKGAGRPTRLKLSLIEWGHRGDKASAVAKGRRLLARYKKMKERKKRKA